MTDRLDDLLRQAGRTYAAAPPARGPRPDDVIARSRVRRRTQRVLAGGLAAVVLLVAIAALGRPADRASQELEQFGGPGVSGPAPTDLAPEIDGQDAATGTTLPWRRIAPPTTASRLSPSTSAIPQVPEQPPRGGLVLPPNGDDLQTVDWYRVGYPAGSCALEGDRLVPAQPFAVSPVRGDDPTVTVRSVDHTDLDDDGHPEAIVWLTCNARGGPDTAWVYTAGGPYGVTLVGELAVDREVRRQLSELTGARAWSLADVSAFGGRVTTTWTGWPHVTEGCCATVQDVQLVHQLVDGRLLATIGHAGRVIG